MFTCYLHLKCSVSSLPFLPPKSFNYVNFHLILLVSLSLLLVLILFSYLVIIHFIFSIHLIWISVLMFLVFYFSLSTFSKRYSFLIFLFLSFTIWQHLFCIYLFFYIFKFILFFLLFRFVIFFLLL